MATAKVAMTADIWTCPGCSKEILGITKQGLNHATAEHVATCTEILASDKVLNAAGKAYLRRNRVVSLTIPHDLHDWAKARAAERGTNFSAMIQELLEEQRKGE